MFRKSCEVFLNFLKNYLFSIKLERVFNSSLNYLRFYESQFSCDAFSHSESDILDIHLFQKYLSLAFAQKDQFSKQVITNP